MKFLTRYYMLLLAFSINNVQSQSYIKGKVVDSLASPIPYIALALINQVDSSIYKGASTDENGIYIFSDLKNGNYLIKVSTLGYKDRYISSLKIDSVTKLSLPDLMLTSNGFNLKEVAISAIKNPIEFKNGNIIVNIEGSPLAIGNSAYDLLSRLPGVMVDNEVITIQGKTGVKIYIDDRVQQVSGAQLVNLLKTLQASAIDKIEIINNPSSKYDASGSSGIINIKTKKIKITGFSGNINYTYSQGFYGTNSTGVSVNYKGKKITLFSNFNYFQGKLYQVSKFEKVVTFDGIETQLNQNGTELDYAKYGSASLAAEWHVNKKNTIQTKIQIDPGYSKRSYSGKTTITDQAIGYDELIFKRYVPNKWYLINYNISSEHLFDTIGTKLLFSGDYYSVSDIYDGSYKNSFLADGVNTLPNQNFISKNDMGLKILVGRLDFEKTIVKTLHMEIGAKISYQDINSNYILQNQNNLTEIYTTDSTYTNIFEYKEQISASYFNFSKSFKKVNIQLGARLENTTINAQSNNNSVKYTRNYLNIFPTFNIDYSKTENHIFSLSYNRNINRPNYSYFNPYRTFINVLNSSEGNPYLLPEYGNNISFTYVIKQKIYNSISYTMSKNPIQSYTSQNDSTKETIQHLSNLNYLDHLRYSFFLNQSIMKWWALNINFGAYYIAYNGNINGSNYSISALPYSLSLNDQFILPKNYKMELNMFYWSPWINGVNIYKARYGINIAVTKSFLNKKLVISAAMKDVFFSQTSSSNASFQNQKLQRFDSYDSRRLQISVNYNFGKIKVQKWENQNSIEEKNRLNR